MGWFDKAKEWMTPERALAFQGIGMGLSQLDAGQPVNLSPVYEALEQRKQQAAMRKVMEVPGVMDKFTPEQQAVLASMPEALATQIIMEHAFKPPPAPVSLQTFTGPDGVVYSFNPISGETAPLTGAEGLDQDALTDGAPNGTMWIDPNDRTKGVQPIPGFQAPVDDPLAYLKARAAAGGLVEGTPEYNNFMINAGPAEGMLIESDGQGGVRVVQGAAAAGAKPFTEAQSKDVVYTTRAKGALETLEPIADALTDRIAVAADWVPMGFGSGAQSDEYQIAKTAGDEFLQAILRKDTGAAITADEQALYGNTYLPRPGDSDARLAYKAEARRRAVAALEAGQSPAQIIASEKALAKKDGQPVGDVPATGNTTSNGVQWSIE
jgi:hypothetical protein